MRATNGASAASPTIVSYLHRERPRTLLKQAFSRRRARTLHARSAAELQELLRTTFVDAVVVDVGNATEETWRAASLAREFPSIPFFAITALRAADGPAVAQCAAMEFADVVVDGVDDAAVRELVMGQFFSSRFAAALRDPPPQLRLETPIQRHAWEFIVNQGGRPVRTSALAEALRVTREHLSRSFAAHGSPNLKRVIDLVRLVAAAELAKNPGYDIRDIARVLEFASSSHLSTTAQRIVGTKPASLTRLRTVDLVDRFVRGHGRSRG